MSAARQSCPFYSNKMVMEKGYEAREWIGSYSNLEGGRGRKLAGGERGHPTACTKLNNYGFFFFFFFNCECKTLRGITGQQHSGWNLAMRDHLTCGGLPSEI